MKRILITGINGQLGQELQQTLAEYDVIGVGREMLDLTQPDKISQMMDEVRPELVIQCSCLHGCG
jgi:dTDP-4-dehydrorhamnose reductase